MDAAQGEQERSPTSGSPRPAGDPDRPGAVTITVVTPVFRSAPYLAELHARCVAAIRSCGAAHQIILVVDAGPPEDLAAARAVAETDPAVVVVELARNAGQHPATMAGLAFATGDLVVVMDSDLDEKPEWIPLFHAEMARLGCDVVYGVSDRRAKGLLYEAMRRLFYLSLNALAPSRFPQNVCTARLMRRPYVDALLRFGERELYMAGVWHMAGFAQAPLLVDKTGESPTTYTPGRLARIFVNAVTAFSTRPLDIIAVVGIALSALAFVYTGYIVTRTLFFGVNVEGWASVMAAVLTIGGVTLFFNGVIAIYVGKIFIEVKQRPRAIVRALHGAQARTPRPHDRHDAPGDHRAL